MADDKDDLRAALEAAGIDLSSPEARRSFRDDIVWAHTQRKRCEKAAGYVIILLVGGVATTVGAWVISGFKEWVR